jgi:hypothetical protein
MRIMITPEFEINKMKLRLNLCSLGGQASPSVVLQAMGARSFKDAVQRMLRLAHIFNDMAPPIPSTTVRRLLEQIMFILPDPIPPLNGHADKNRDQYKHLHQDVL